MRPAASRSAVIARSMAAWSWGISSVVLVGAVASAAEVRAGPKPAVAIRTIIPPSQNARRTTESMDRTAAPRNAPVFQRL